MRPSAAGTIGQCISAGERGRGAPRKPPTSGELQPTLEKNASSQVAPSLSGRGDDIAGQVPGRELEKQGNLANVGDGEEARGCACVGRNGPGKVLDGQAKEAEGRGGEPSNCINKGKSDGELGGVERVEAERPLHAINKTSPGAAESSAGTSIGITSIGESATQTETGILEAVRVSSPPRPVIPDDPPGQITHPQANIREFRSPPRSLIIPSRFSFDSPHRPTLIPESPEIRQLKRRLSSSKVEADPVLASYFKEVETSTKEHLIEEALGSPHVSAEDLPNRPANLPANHTGNRRSFKTVKRLITLQDKEGNK